MAKSVLTTHLAGLPEPRRGKVRDIYDLGDKILLVATDRISAFDVVFPTPIPDKGRVLTKLTLFWLDLLSEILPNHLLSASADSLGLDDASRELLEGRAIIAKKAEVVPFECIVRGYIIGSGWKEYQAGGSVSGIRLPDKLQIADKLPEPIFTPSTKAEEGHDENITYATMVKSIGEETASKLREASLALYSKAASHALKRGIIIADTKFEFGLRDGSLILIDEVLTPDSSRFWPLDAWKPGVNPPSFDKQYLRDWLEKESGWRKEPPAPELPDKVVEETRAKYIEAYERLTGGKF